MESEILISIAEYLGKEMDRSRLLRLQQLLETQSYYITVWGHYSAGKSRLLNNILGRDILPVQSRETTAALTYILYGEDEECRIYYKDGSFTRREIGSLKKIFQNTEEQVNFSEITHMEVYVNHDLLKKGLVIVDTPGVNTVIQEHLDLALDAMEQSGRILYVLGGSPSKVDEEFIHQMVDCGIECTFVRTKCDTIRGNEENAEESLDIEAKTLRRITGEDTAFIPVSNEQDSKWFDNIHKVTELLYQTADNISNEMNRTIQKRFAIYVSSYMEALSEKKEQLEKLADGQEKEIEEKIRRCEVEMEQLQSILSDLDKQIASKLASAEESAKNDISRQTARSIAIFNESIEQMPIEEQHPANVQRICETQMRSLVKDLERILYD